jgi:uncharacterized protein (DUF1501 family)
MISRRQMLGTAALGLIAASFPRLAFAAVPGDKRLVVVILRGAMDGLSAVPAYSDPAFADVRGKLAGSKAEALPLDEGFALHPALAGLHRRYQAKELIAFHAIASPYRDRSHFDGQNVIETGGAKPFGLPDGWLSRALADLPANGRDRGVALAPTMPLIARGPGGFTSWSPSLLPGPDADLVARLSRLYAGDKVFASALAGAVEANGAMGQGEKGNGLEPLMAAAAKFLAEPDGPCAAVVDVAGWDTHINQAGAYGPLVRNLKALDAGLETLAQGLGARWADTAVIVMTEFGRTVAMNGTGGTDHGTGGAALLLGGAVAGGRVITDWPGLATAALLENRDLKPTMSLYAPLKALLADHLRIPTVHIERIVFPDSARIRPLPDLLRHA